MGILDSVTFTSTCKHMLSYIVFSFRFIIVYVTFDNLWIHTLLLGLRVTQQVFPIVLLSYCRMVPLLENLPILF